MDVTLNSLCKYRNEKIDASKVGRSLYISTENMLPNKGGISGKAGAPTTGKVSLYRKNDILISNIRPYFKKYGKQRPTDVALMTCLFSKRIVIAPAITYFGYRLTTDFLIT